jgi:hypothetical protein
MKIYRQGDILLRQVKSIPKGKRVVRPNGHVQYGEKTGHVHRVLELDQAEVLEVGENGLFLSVSEAGVSIVHEDHATLKIPAGNFQILRQVEYAPEAIRNVQD